MVSESATLNADKNSHEKCVAMRTVRHDRLPNKRDADWPIGFFVLESGNYTPLRTTGCRAWPGVSCQLPNAAKVTRDNPKAKGLT